MDLSYIFNLLHELMPFLPAQNQPVFHALPDLVSTAFLLIATISGLLISIERARFWRAISTGFFLLFCSQVWVLTPYASSFLHMTAINSAVSAISILMISYGIQEYYIFTRTLEARDSRVPLYITLIIAILAVTLIIYQNPKPNLFALRNYRIMECTIWLFLSFINIYVVFSIWREMKGAPTSAGIASLCLVFICLAAWKGSSLYLLIYQWDNSWQSLVETYYLELKTYGMESILAASAYRLNSVAGLLAGILSGVSFTWLYTLFR